MSDMFLTAQPYRSATVLPVSDGRQASFPASVVDDLQYALAVGQILEPEFLDQAAVVDQVVPRLLLPAGLLVEGDLRVGQELAHELGEVAQADRRSPRTVDRVTRLVGQQHPREHLGNIVDMDRAAHR